MGKRGINKVQILGHLGKDPEVRFMPNGEAVANITVATSESWKDKQSGEQKENTEWHRVTFYRRLAEVVGEYLKKGSKIYLEGRLQTRKWQGQDGQDRYTTEIIAHEMQMLDTRGGDNVADIRPNAQPTAQPQNGANGQPNNNNANQNQHRGQNQNHQQAVGQDFQNNGSHDNFLDEDIPF